jgi:hypothetical protein
MWSRAMKKSHLVLVVVVVGLILVTVPSSARAAYPAPTVTALWSSPATGKQPVIEVFSVLTGEPLRQLLKLPGWPSDVEGPFAGPAGSLWYSVSTGPKSSCPRCMEGTPLPNSCRTKLMRFDPSTGISRTVLVLPASETAGGPVPSPNGSRVVYEAEPCTGYEDSHYVVADLRTGRSVEIGATDTPCHVAFQPSWSPNGRELTFAWSPSTMPKGSPVHTQFCPQWRNGEIAVVPAAHSGPITAAELRSAGPGCSYVAAAFDTRGIVAAKDCGAQGDWLGTATLVQLSDSFRLLARLPLPSRPDSLTLSVSPGGEDVLINEYQAPAPFSPGNIPTEWLIAFTGHALRTIVRDQTGVDSLEFAMWG